jgi:hypothetical protein
VTTSGLERQKGTVVKVVGRKGLKKHPWKNSMGVAYYKSKMVMESEESSEC